MSESVPEKPRVEADLHRISVNAVILARYSDMQLEYEHHLGTASRVSRNLLSYSSMATCESMGLSQARGFPEIESDYKLQRQILDSRFGDPAEHSWQLYANECSLRKQLLEGLLYDLGIIRVDERPESVKQTAYSYAYAVDGREYIHQKFAERLAENRNLVLIFDGKPGGGKSWAGLSIGDYESTGGFDLTALVYSIDDFISQIRSRGPGQVLILDEAGIGAGSRDSMSKESKVLGKVIQSVRYLKYLTIFTVPSITFLDKQIRLLCDLVLSHEEGMRQGEFVPMVPRVSDNGKDVEFVGLREGGRVIRSMFFPSPRPYLISKYEQLRKTHNLQQLSDLQDSIRKEKPGEQEPDGRGRNENSLRNLKRFNAGGEKNEEIEA